jgi:transposase InsO family protein
MLRELKAEHVAAHKQHLVEQRVSVAVHARDAVWTLDATHVGRELGGAAVQAEVVRDVASSKILWAGVGLASEAEDVVDLLEALRRLRAGLPLVLLTDNGSAYANELVEAYLKERQVVHLLNLPHTPQHNPWGERANGELKAETGLGKGVLLRDHREASERLVPALERLNCQRPRASRGWRTPAQADAQMPPWSALVDRGTFWKETRCACAEGVVGCTGKRAARRARREAQLATLEKYELITRTRGDA